MVMELKSMGMLPHKQIERKMDLGAWDVWSSSGSGVDDAGFWLLGLHSNG